MGLKRKQASTGAAKDLAKLIGQKGRGARKKDSIKQVF
jgi:hypothetical protein